MGCAIAWCDVRAVRGLSAGVVIKEKEEIKNLVDSSTKLAIIDIMFGIHEIVTKFLLSKNLPTKLKGYRYLKEGIIFVIQSDALEYNKVVLSNIAAKFNTATDNIERCIRTLINKTWGKNSRIDFFGTKPSVREFIVKCAEHIISRNQLNTVQHLNDRNVLETDFTQVSAYDILAK